MPHAEVDVDDVLLRIERAFDAADGALAPFTPGEVAARQKAGGDPVTDADLALDTALKAVLLRDGEGWLSEETTDDKARLDHAQLWIVDPLDGTKEFVKGVPEWCVSIAFVDGGVPVAGGIYNPATQQRIVGAVGQGVQLNGEAIRVEAKGALDGGQVLASNSELKRGEWDAFMGQPYEVKPTGSVAYKLGLVAAGLAEATWTLCPKNEWDVAAGVALVHAAGGHTWLKGGGQRVFNQEDPLLPGLLACGPGLQPAVAAATGESAD